MRKSSVNRETKETKIDAALCLDGGDVSVSTGIGFFDHMLTAFAIHGNFGLSLCCDGDLDVDFHHTVEDVGIVLGQCFKLALADNSSVERYGTFFVPMDESLVMVSLDISNRAFLSFDANLPQEKIGNFDSCLCEEFFRAFAFNAGLTLHIKCLSGKNSHHIAEAMFKAIGHAMKNAVLPRENGVLSTKGTL